MAAAQFLLLLALSAAVSAEEAVFKACPDIIREHCTVTAVRITPCNVPTKCRLKKGENASISFDFTPNFATTNLKTAVYWPSNDGEKEFAEMDNNGCSLTTCPTVSGTSQTLNYNLYIGKKLPKGQYQIRWKVWNADNDVQKCCFESTILLPPSKNKNKDNDH